ncbi:MAG: hypothetical protein J6J31_05115, partial [Thermoguttaceae bacterium]|nr:hypothetical protein [Thermoguttaceae bacterium]
GSIPSPPKPGGSDAKAADFTGSIPSPPKPGEHDAKAADFTGSIPSPPKPGEADAKPADFTGTIPSPPKPGEHDTKAADFTGTIPSPPKPGEADAKAADFTGSIPSPPKPGEHDAKAADFTGTIPSPPKPGEHDARPVDITKTLDLEEVSAEDLTAEEQEPLSAASISMELDEMEAEADTTPIDLEKTIDLEDEFADDETDPLVLENQKRIEPAVAGFLQNEKRIEPAVAGFLQNEKRVEPAVAGFLQNGKWVEPPVAGILPNGKRVEPAVAGILPNGKRVEPAVAGILPNGKRVEPPVAGGFWGKHTEPAVRGFLNGRRIEPPVAIFDPNGRRIEPPVLSAPGFFGMVFTPSNNYLMQQASTFIPELRGNETEEELTLREELLGLHFQAQRRLKKGKWLANASFAVVALACLLGAWAYQKMVMSYANVRSDFAIVRDVLEPERILLTYTPEEKGRLAVSYADAQRRTTIEEKLAPEQVGQVQTFGWRIRDLKEEDKITLTFREDLQLVDTSRTIGDVQLVAVNSTEPLTDCRLAGEICDATTGKPIPGATLRIPGTKFTVESGPDGGFELLGFPDGLQSFEASADGFISYRFDSASRELPVRILLSPGLADGQIRVVLSWERKPEDLDAHLEGPLPNDGSFHISYGNRGNVDSEFVNLDIDDSDGFGPETITVLGVVPGTYRYYVHNYSQQSELQTDTLARSDASVRVYYGNQVIGTFRPDMEKLGNLWNVCEIEISKDQQASVRVLGDFEDKCVQAMGLYEKRTQEDRLEWIEDVGGNASSEEAAARALEWLARHQCTFRGKRQGRNIETFGSWGRYCLDPESKCCRCAYPHLTASAEAPGAPNGETTPNEGPAVEKSPNGEPSGEELPNDLHEDAEMADAGEDGASSDAENGEGPKTHGRMLCMDSAPDYSAATTGLAVLAFQAGGHYFFNGHKYSENVTHGLDWLAKIQDSRGAIVTPMSDGSGIYHEKFMYEHGIAAFALAEACALAKAEGEEIPPKYYRAMKLAIDFILRIQHLDGGWRYKTDPAEVSDTSVTGWQILALKSAKEAGYKIPQPAIDKIALFYSKHTRGDETRYTSTMGGTTEALTGIGLLVRQFLLDQGGAAYVHLGAKRLAKFAMSEWEAKKEEERVPDFYSWYKCSLAMQQYGGKEWEIWNEIVRNELVRLQRRGDDCLTGSWDPESDVYFEMGGGGRIYVTAMGALTLQVYYRYTTQEERRAHLLPSSGSLQTQNDAAEEKAETPHTRQIHKTRRRTPGSANVIHPAESDPKDPKKTP